METIIFKHKALLQKLLDKSANSFDNQLQGKLPTQGGVYRIFENGETWQNSIYVGKTNNIRRRVYKNHFMGSRQASTLRNKLARSFKYENESDINQYLQDNCLVQFLVISEDDNRTSLEHFAVAILHPKYND